MGFVKTKDGAEIFYKDWGSGPPLVFHHGWPLSSDDWDAQLMFFLSKGFRVIAHDRRGHGRSSQTFDGNEMDTYAADVAALASRLDLKGAVHIGHSTGGGEVARYVAQHGDGRADFTDDLKKIDVPTLVMHGDDDQIVPIEDSALLSAKLLKKATLKVYPGFGHGLCTINADTVNADLLAFIRQ